MDEHKLDGNLPIKSAAGLGPVAGVAGATHARAAGGPLGEAFAFEVTTAEGACGNCGTVAHMGEAMAYMTEIGTVVRCPTCDNALIRFVHNPRGCFLDARGVSYLHFESAP